jgi:hypothetical protein
MRSHQFIAFLPVLLAGCKNHTPPIESHALPVANWHSLITEADRGRLRDWRQAFTRAIDAARQAGNGLSIDREGNLLEPDAALDGAGPPPGPYQCRVIKLGAQASTIAKYTVFPNYHCDIATEGPVASFAKRDGIQRPVGLIFPDSATRKIFLGTMMLGDETLALQYGRDDTRDMVGAVERLGADRWRILLPYPHFESMMDVIELIPDKGR